MRKPRSENNARPNHSASVAGRKGEGGRSVTSLPLVADLDRHSIHKRSSAIFGLDLCRMGKTIERLYGVRRALRRVAGWLVCSGMGTQGRSRWPRISSYSRSHGRRCSRRCLRHVLGRSWTYHRQRTVRGQGYWLSLPCRTLSFPIPSRFIPALSLSFFCLHEGEHNRSEVRLIAEQDNGIGNRSTSLERR